MGSIPLCSTNGEMSEWLKESVLKTDDTERYRGFESHSPRQLNERGTVMEERHVPRNIGDQIPTKTTTIIEISGLSSVVPVRYNGIDNTYDVCEPSKATHHAIVSDDDYCVLVTVDCMGKEALMDII